MSTTISRSARITGSQLCDRTQLHQDMTEAGRRIGAMWR